MKYQFAVDNADHLIAIDNTVIYLRDEGDDFPWEEVKEFEAGASYRLNMPSSCYAVIHKAGLTLKYGVDFEHQDANGRGISLFDRNRLRWIMMKCSVVARTSLSRLLEVEVLPEIKKRSAEIRKSLSLHLDSEDCVRGLIAFAAEIQ